MSLRIIVCLILGTAVIAAAACDGGAAKRPATPTPRAVPSPVTFPQAPVGDYKLGDPTQIFQGGYGVTQPFVARPGASVDAGRLGGSVYQIEVPDNWNGRLVLYVKPQGNAIDPSLNLISFSLRSYLIRNGYAWGETSGSSKAAGVLPEEIAALWDLFAQRDGRPHWTYITGDHDAAIPARIAAARYPDRFDGVLTACGAVQPRNSAATGDFFVAGAFVAGVDQTEFDAADINEVINTRIRPALLDPVRRARFEDIAIQLSGGPRPLAREGLRLEEDSLWDISAFQVGAGFFDNVDRAYRLHGAAGVSDEAFNAAVLRRSRGNPDIFRRVNASTDESYDLKIPLLTINVTGDAVDPIANDQLLLRKTMAAGSGELLVQRTVRRAVCQLADGEWQRGLGDLAAWVEQGKKPEGEDLLAEDLTGIGKAFTRLPSLGSLEAEALPGAKARLSLSGTLKFDGQPLAASEPVWVVVVKDGVLQNCTYETWSARPAAAGRYELHVAADEESRGCGSPGARLYIVMYSSDRGRFYVSQDALDWPSGTTNVTFDPVFSSDHPIGAGVGPTPEEFIGTVIEGVVLDASGHIMPPGTLVEAYIGESRCAIYGLARVQMQNSSTTTEASAYTLAVSSPALKPECKRDAEVSFRVNGKPVAQTARNTFGFFNQELDLMVED